MKKVLLSTIFAIIMLGVMACFSKVEAATSWTDNDTTIDITRTITGVTNTLNNITFTYTITADSNNPSGGVNGSISPATPTVVFNNVSPSNGSASATTTLNTSGLSFTAPGVYKFRVTETQTNNNAFPVDSTDYYDIVINVENELNNGVPTGNYVATLLQQAQDRNGTKNDIVFTSAADLECIQITKTVTGAAGDTNAYFPFTVNIADAGTYTVSGGSYTNNPSTISGNSNATVYLKSGETITIGQASGVNQILPSTSYTITEDATAANGYTVYTTTGSGSETENNSRSVTTTVSTTDANNHVTFRNNKGSQSVTGILLDIAPYICLVVLAIVGIIIIKKNTVK